MGIFDSFIKRRQAPQKEPNFSFKVQYDNDNKPISAQIKEQTGIDLSEEYVQISTSGDDCVCPMCAQFEDKIFPANDAPKLPLCPSCSCSYIHYFKADLPSGTVISKKENFTLPAKCTHLFYKHQHSLYEETDIDKQIRLCEADLKKLPEFIMPYLIADFHVPEELVCRDLLPELYMQLGKWDKAEATIKKCIAANAYYPQNGLNELTYLASYQKVATEALSYIKQHPGCLQRNIYKALSYEGEKREHLKHFLSCSKQIRKVKHGNTNELYPN